MHAIFENKEVASVVFIYLWAKTCIEEKKRFDEIFQSIIIFKYKLIGAGLNGSYHTSLKMLNESCFYYL